MILPVYLYGCPVLRKRAVEIEADYPKLNELIDNMWETMYKSDGIGLAAPQVGLSIRLFIVDISGLEDEGENLEDFKKVFINPKINNYSADKESLGEGCLSLPGIREDVNRPDEIEIEYFDENFTFHKETFRGFAARVVQHEYDHLEGTLFIDYLSPLKRKMLKGKLNSISKGKTDADYRTVTP